MNQLENALNRMTDMDWGWWPLLRLRPPKEQDLGNAVLLQLALFFGTVAVLFAFLLCAVFVTVPPLLPALGLWLGATVLFFFTYKFTFALCWNRRAARLRHGMQAVAEEN